MVFERLYTEESLWHLVEWIFHVCAKWRENSEKNLFPQTGKLFMTVLSQIFMSKKSGVINDYAKCLHSNCEKREKCLLSGSSSITCSTFRIFSLLLLFLVPSKAYNKSTTHLSNVDKTCNIPYLLCSQFCKYFHHC